MSNGTNDLSAFDVLFHRGGQGGDPAALPAKLAILIPFSIHQSQLVRLPPVDHFLRHRIVDAQAW